jgi:hypothetical protein
VQEWRRGAEGGELPAASALSSGSVRILSVGFWGMVNLGARAPTACTSSI